MAGKRSGLDGDRSGLFFEAIRIVRDVRPAFAVFENVPGLFSSNRGWDFAAVLDSLAECGALDIAWRVLDAQYAGVPQRRDRVFVVADFRGERAGEILSLAEGVRGHSATGQEEREDVAPCLRSGTVGGRSHGKVNGTVTNSLGANAGRNQIEQTYVPSTHAPAVAFTQNQNGDVLTGNVSHALSTNQNASGRNSGKVAGTFGVRRLTPVEAERLMGLPDNWTNVPDAKGKPAADGPRYRILGNGVVIPVVEQIAERMAWVIHEARRAT